MCGCFLDRLKVFIVRMLGPFALAFSHPHHGETLVLVYNLTLYLPSLAPGFLLDQRRCILLLELIDNLVVSSPTPARSLLHRYTLSTFLDKLLSGVCLVEMGVRFYWVYLLS